MPRPVATHDKASATVFVATNVDEARAESADLMRGIKVLKLKNSGETSQVSGDAHQKGLARQCGPVNHETRASQPSSISSSNAGAIPPLSRVTFTLEAPRGARMPSV